ncbi:MAG: ABC transporter permease [Acidobacteria bacterium]|nr:ABC transporter permease [Acidobacteriota bacterium]MBI3428405.1 ABC transporter permease [Acidobacteriota bacterium]
METLFHDLSHALRRLTQNPGFTAVALLSLALGIGANSALFSVANALLLRPLPFKDADRVAILWNRSPGLNVEQDWFSLGQYLDIKLENRSFEAVAVARDSSFNLTGQGQPEYVEGARVSSSLFPLLGAQPVLGRVLTPSEDEKGAAPVVLLSYGFWQRRFGGARAVLGRTLTLNDNNFTIVGVVGPEFTLSKEVLPTVNGIRRADVLLPLPMSAADRSNRGGEDFNILAKLKPGVSFKQAQAEMDALAEQMKRQYPESYPANGRLTLSVVPLLEQVVGNLRLALYVLLGAVGFVLLIACANVANLLLARASVRQKEMVIRAAVGASRARIVRQLLTESVLLGVLGGLLGLGLALVAGRALRAFGPENLPRSGEIGVDGRVLAFTIAVSVLTGVIFGLLPALRESRVDLNEVLKDGGRSATGGHQRTRKLLVVVEVALALVLLIGAGLLLRSYAHILRANPGFNPNNVLALRLTLPATRYATPEAVYNFYKQLGERVRQVPGVEFTGTSYGLPLSATSAAWGPVTVEGYVPRAASELIISNERFVSPDQLRALGMPLVKGRHFDERDVRKELGGTLDVTLVNEAFAQRFWPGEDPLGKHIQRSGKGPWRTVVGVVRDAKEVALENEPALTLYHPIDQFNIRTRYLVARSSNKPEALTAAITSAVHALDAQLPVYEAATLQRRLHNALAQRRFALVLLGVFAAVALTLAVLGIYGVLTYWVTQRTHELGIRVALGAAQRDIVRLVIRQALALVLLGVGLGLAGALALTRVLASLLFGVSTTDGLTFAGLALLLAAIALLTSYLPARRAARVNPLVALRCE